MVASVMEDITAHREITRNAALNSYSNAKELAVYLVSKDVPCRNFHQIVSEAVVYANSKSKALEELRVDEFKRFSDVISEDVYAILSLESCLNKRCAKGGVSPQRVAEAIAEAKQLIK